SGIDHARISSSIKEQPPVSALLSENVGHQDDIHEVRGALDRVDQTLFDARWPRERVLELAIDTGCFYDLGSASEAQRPFAALQVMKKLAGVSNGRALATAWTKSLRSENTPLSGVVPTYPDEDDFDFEEEPATNAGARQQYENVRAQQVAIVEQ